MLNGPTDTTSRPVTSGQSWPFAPRLVGSAEPVIGEERDGLGWTTWLPRSQLVRMSSPVAATAATTRRPLPEHDPVHVPTTGDDGGSGLAVHTRTARAGESLWTACFLTRAPAYVAQAIFCISHDVNGSVVGADATHWICDLPA
jgi:hypothetical protein